MPRQKRADEAGGIYHALNRGNRRQTIFRKDGDYEAFLQVLTQGLELYPVELFAYVLMPNHWHMVLRPVDGIVSRGGVSVGQYAVDQDFGRDGGQEDVRC